MKLVIISNNPMVRDRYAGTLDVRYVDGSGRDVLRMTRDECHRGHRLLSHPLSGSVKPNETLYKSIMVSGQAGAADRESVELIEKAILTFEKFGPVRRQWREAERKDFQLVDLCLIESALESAAEDPENY